MNEYWYTFDLTTFERIDRDSEWLGETYMTYHTRFMRLERIGNRWGNPNYPQFWTYSLDFWPKDL